MPLLGQTEFVSGCYETVPHTPSGAVSAGQVIVVGEIPFVAHHDIAAGELGSVAVTGGKYRGLTDGSLDTGGALVYWDDDENEFVASATGNKHFGYTLPDQGATADQDEIVVIHKPDRAGS